ncbi:type II toxin-antitoxin system RelE/ParE family toxin [Cupriavidus basilensis]|uniref:type II toxin-antitoxin system RelE/ParE family toxin n=1 Tax=Cupriavidus basilensis TaxID=68895 RepID=UPI0023E881E8|nr:type II toxin-antitoxin system RelE/ParE family toxin [Cupriavidus basilensis]MDF3882518.1 type II toxin-antitoxin system RelE/ParE family toxin [Cupriavidus basilensis]
MTRVDFADAFQERIETIEAFMLLQDVSSAPGRMEALWEEIHRFRDLVMTHPRLGRPAEILAAGSDQESARLDDLLRLAVEAGVPDIREYVIHSHVILYAYSDSRVVVLSIRHQRELGYADDE